MKIDVAQKGIIITARKKLQLKITNLMYRAKTNKEKQLQDLENQIQTKIEEKINFIFEIRVEGNKFFCQRQTYQRD